MSARDDGRGAPGSSRDPGAASDRGALEAELLEAQKLESVGRLARGLAHDFHNLITAILHNARVLHDRLPADSPLRDDVTEIERAGTRASEITGRLLAFVRNRAVAERVVDSNAVVRGVTKLVAGSVPSGIALSIELASEPLHARIDPGQLEQIVMNLVLNARDAMPTGGSLVIATRKIEEDGELEVAVSDTGHGMTPEVRARLFEPFFTTKSAAPSAGLGLANVEGIVREARGRIDVDSAPGQGARFRVRLPLATPEDVAAAAALEPNVNTPVPPSGGETVLLVEDEKMVRTAVARGLELGGYRVVEADGPTEALALVGGDHHFDLLLTDMVMPGMNGVELARRVLLARPALPTLVMSGYGEEVLAARAPLPLIEKPFTVDELARRVREVLDDTRAEP